jgi:hypothetical protein
MNPFTEHTQQQGITYFEHWRFAMGIAWRLLNVVIAFVLHAVFPFITIEPHYDLEATMSFLDERNRWIEDARAENPSVSPSLLRKRGEYL